MRTGEIETSCAPSSMGIECRRITKAINLVDVSGRFMWSYFGTTSFKSPLFVFEVSQEFFLIVTCVVKVFEEILEDHMVDSTVSYKFGVSPAESMHSENDCNISLLSRFRSQSKAIISLRSKSLYMSVEEYDQLNISMDDEETMTCSSEQGLMSESESIESDLGDGIGLSQDIGCFDLIET